MKIDGKIIACSTGEKGISIQIEVESFMDKSKEKSKEDAKQLLKWAIYNSALKIQLSEDTTQIDLDVET